MIVICACSFRKLIPEDAIRQVIGSLTRSGQELTIVDDLCRMAAHDKDALVGIDGNTVVACHPRAVKALFDAAGSRVGEVYNLRTEQASEVIAQISLSPQPPPHKGGGGVQSSPLPSKSTTPLPCGEGTGERSSKELPKPQGVWQPWFPVIDHDRCTACRQCVDYCLFGVYSMDSDSVHVVNPAACKDNCPACARICPEKAIIFPKYDKSPINGGLTDDDDTMGLDMRELYRTGDLYSKLAARNRNMNQLTDEDDKSVLYKR